MLGVCVGTLEDVPGLKYPTLRRVDPQWLRYRWASGAGSTNWWYTTAVGAPINVRPGDGRWVLAENGIAASPWERGLFFPASQLYIQKFSCILESMNYENGLANPTILATSPQGATDLDRGDWSQAWSEIGPNRVISAPPGYDAKGLEIGKSGWESFQQSIKRCNEEMLVLCLGNTVSTLGNSGFSSASIYRDVKDVLVQDGARILEDIINKQILPQWVGRVYGWDKIEQSPCIEIDTHAPRDPTALAQAWTQAASALPQIETWLKSHEEELGLELDIQEVLVRYGIPTRSRQIRTAAERIGDGSWDVDITELDSGEESIDEIAEVA
jgi:phage gp29-like protein